MLRAFTTIAFLSTGLWACQPASMPPSIEVENGYIRAPLPGQSTAVAYFDIVSLGGPDVLLAARSNASLRVELHNHIHEAGVMKMRKVDSVNLPQKGVVSFTSGGLHVMMFDAKIDGEVTLTLDFEQHEDIVVKLDALPN